MRCLSLAEGWQKAGGKAVFVMAESMPSLDARLKYRNVDFVKIKTKPGSFDDSFKTVQLAEKLSASWIVLDGYNFDSAYQKTIKNSTKSLLTIDDMGRMDHYYADIVVNQNLHADKSKYTSKEGYTSLLLGTTYVLLRQDFSRWQGWKKTVHKNAKNILITLGGSDENNMTKTVIEAIQIINSDDLKVVVVVPNNAYYEELETLVKHSTIDICLKKNVTTMADLMAWADIAVSAGGTSTWELAFMGVPMITIAIADNQLQVVDELSKVGVAVNLGWYKKITLPVLVSEILKLINDYDKRAAMSKKGRMIVDGKGVERVLAEMEKYASQTKEAFKLRPANKDDATFLWHLANDPAIRQASFSSVAIPWEKHISWLTEKLNDSSCRLFVATNMRDVPIGQIRFDLKSGEAIMSISLQKEYRGKGIGATLITMAINQIFESTNVNKVNAYVKPQNTASISSFLKANFKDNAFANIKGHNAVHLMLERGS
jgi:UDP-2,4-diacetamido-2,4,6-trideoxy-beta-L-altropyranose hydrolase